MITTIGLPALIVIGLSIFLVIFLFKRSKREREDDQKRMVDGTEEVSKPKKYWWFFILCYIVGFHVIGGIYNDYAYAFGFLFFALLIGGLKLHFARLSGSIKSGHLIHIVMISFFVFLAFRQSNEEVVSNLFDGCRNNNSVAVSSHLSDKQKDEFCGCVSNLTKNAFLFHSTSSTLTFREPIPFGKNLDLQTTWNAAWLTCERQL